MRLINMDARVRETIFEVVERLKKAYQPGKIILFGSYAYGRPDDDSDVDLLTIKDTEDDEALLGVVTLEILDPVFNPFKRTLEPMRMLLV